MSAPATASTPLAAFAGCGIELEYMIADRDSLDVRPIADRLLRGDGEGGEVRRGEFGWSNELVAHLVEIKNPAPAAAPAGLADGFQGEVRCIDELLADHNARLMPTAMHPWMDPARETRVWSHSHAVIYAAYDRIFDCRAHGWANIQAMHVNLPFANDAEFARLHAAVRLLLPILPALAASSPVADGRARGALDFRLQCYRQHPARVPELIGALIPDNLSSQAQFAQEVLAPMYRAIAPHDPDGVLRHEWLNARGAIPRFDRQALEIRVIDIQECPRADLAIAAAAGAVARALYDGRWSTLAQHQGCTTAALVRLLDACSRDAEQALIDDAAYLALFGFPGARCTARELWCHLLAACAADPWLTAQSCEVLEHILTHGTLARRILRALGADASRARLMAVYRQLCDCLAQGCLFAAEAA